MTDQVTIANLALDAIGTRSEVVSLDEDSQSARTLSLHYRPAIETLLQAAHWNFARKQVSLAVAKAAAGTPENPTGNGDTPPAPWMYSYELPSDCVATRYVMPDMSSPSPSASPGASIPYFSGPPVRFMLSSDTDTQGNAATVLLTNQPNAVLVYTYRVTNEELFDGGFVTALYNYLGFRISNRLTGDKKLTEIARNVAEDTVRKAQASNGNEGLTIIDSMPDWIRVRGYASDWASPDGSMFWNPPQNLAFIT